MLETGSVEALKHYARDLSERIIPVASRPRGGRHRAPAVGRPGPVPFEKYKRDFAFVSRVLQAYEPAANGTANTVAVSFVEERERVIRQQPDAIRELSTPVLPVLPVRERLLILPTVGVLGGDRADQLVRASATITRRSSSSTTTGAPDVDATGVNHPVQLVDASRLRGTSVIITELPTIAQKAGVLRVDLSMWI